MHSFASHLAGLLLLAGLATTAYAQSPPGAQIPYQGFLTDAAGTPLTQTLEIEFTLTDGGGSTWSETALVDVTEGAFTHYLGSVEALQGTPGNAVDFAAPPITLTLTIDPNGTSPETVGPVPLGAVPTAYEAIGGGSGSFALPFSGSGAVDGFDSGVFSIANTGTGDGLRVEEAGGDGIVVRSTGNDGVAVGGAGAAGLRIFNAGTSGVEVRRTEGDGVVVLSAGSDGVKISNAEDDGVEVRRASINGVEVESAGGNGFQANNVGGDGFRVNVAGDTNGDESADTVADGVSIGRAGGAGVSVGSAAGAGISIGSAGSVGLRVGFAGDTDGDLVIDNTFADGVEVLNAGDDGVSIVSAGGTGIDVVRAGRNGVQVVEADDHGIEATGGDGNFLRTTGTGQKDADLILGGTGSTSNEDNSVLASDPAYSSSDLLLVSNDVVAVVLNNDSDIPEGDGSEFVVQDRGGTSLFSVDENGDGSFGGTLTASSKNFRIDHPLDPAGKTLRHASVESNELLVSYSGTATTDGRGEAVVRLPGYVEALATDFRYQLTVIGTFAQAIVGQKIANGRFTIRTSAPDVEVSWRVEGVRQDAWARANPLVVEEAKGAPKADGPSALTGEGRARQAQAAKDAQQRRLQKRQEQERRRNEQRDAPGGALRTP